ncbi:MAG: diaminopimelate decarboxylase [Burkholderiaceae bacterium]|nr:MAG: diaminopimelate decarboxylase [Burkholderiaceae bacterium]
MTPTQFFPTLNGVMHAERVPLPQLAAQFGTPLYVYSKAALVAAWENYQGGLVNRNALVCYAMKTNSNLAILRLFGELGSGFDIVSGGELLRVIAAGCDPKKAVFSGVGKSAEEIRLALTHDVLCFNVESESELLRISEVATAMNKSARVSLRVNPNVDAKTHPYISTGLKENKFGVEYESALDLYKRAASLPHIEVAGIDCHIGSQLTEIRPYLDALDKVLDLVDALAKHGIKLHHLDLGGGLGIRYDKEEPPAAADLLAQLFARIESRGYGALKVLFEPGRSLVGNAGVLLTKVEYLKHNADKNFAIVDAAMNDLMRPALYDAWHGIDAVRPRSGVPTTYDIVGPVCESGDWLGKNRALKLEQGDLLAVLSAGSYAMAMSSNYNTRTRAAEVMVDGDAVYLVRERERVQDLFALERVPQNLAG